MNRLLRTALVSTLVVFSIALSLVLAPFRSARAQDTGFAINRFDRAEVGSDWFSGESLDLRGHVRPAFGLALDYASEPLVLYRANDEPYQALVKSQLHAHLGGSLVLWERIRFGVNAPLVLTQSGDSGTVPGTAIAYSGDTTLGDIRVGLDARLVGVYGDAFTLALGVQAHLPSGSRDAYSGDGALRLVPRLMIAGDISAFVYSARVALAYRAQDAGIGNVPTGSELDFVVTAGARFGHFLIGPELWSSTVLSAAFEKGTTPAEVMLGAHYTLDDFRFGLGAGTGITRGVGTPSYRLLASIEWAPGIEKEQEPLPAAQEATLPPPDQDEDGIIDARDACVAVKGAPSRDPKLNGCPKDSDADGILDVDDACIEDAGVEDEDPEKNGCPLDSDGDGVADAVDHCPSKPGVASDDPKKNGCPPDSDGDGILDADDACPEIAGASNTDPEKNGCPIARVEKGQIKITDRIEFKTNSAKILESSDEVLQAVLTILAAHPEIERLSLEGHTDNVGKPKYNLKLSQQRTDSVRRWLVMHGIDKARLEAHGYGQERPLASNETEEGREKNRRVEFHIKPVDPSPADSDTPDMVFEEAQ